MIYVLLRNVNLAKSKSEVAGVFSTQQGAQDVIDSEPEYPFVTYTIAEMENLDVVNSGSINSLDVVPLT